MAFLELKDISKTYGAFAALGSCSLELDAGQLLAVLGPSGCGKTTLLMILAGLLSKNAGSIWLNGRQIDNLPPEKRGIGLVFQHYALFPNLTVAENILYGLPRRKVPDAVRQERLEELLTLTNLQAMAGQYPGQLSGGQQQRVALARALAPKPGLLLLDEPLSALDAQQRVTLGGELRRIQRKLGVTAIMVTHDRSEALALADKVAVMSEGHIEQVASPQVIYGQPASQFVGNFVGDMNILHIEPIRQGRATGIRPEDVILRRPSDNLLQFPHTWVGRVESESFKGQNIRIELLLNDFITQIKADIARPVYEQEQLAGQKFLAVTLPKERWCTWD